MNQGPPLYLEGLGGTSGAGCPFTVGVDPLLLVFCLGGREGGKTPAERGGSVPAFSVPCK